MFRRTLFACGLASSLSVTLAFISAQQNSPVCRQTTSPAARTARFDGGAAITGAGTFTPDAETTQYVWTGRECVAWIIVRGRVAPADSERSISLGANGEFVAYDEFNGVTREYRLLAGREPSLTRDGRPVSLSSTDREWLAEMVREFIRRSGLNADARARALAAARGVAGLMTEAQLIPRAPVRAQYLVAGYPFIVSAAERASFIRDAAMLIDGSSRAPFLAAMPTSWRSDTTVLLAAYQSIVGIDEDDVVESVIRMLPPPRPVPFTLHTALRTVISTFATTERRAALTAEYLGPSRH